MIVSISCEVTPYDKTRSGHSDGTGNKIDRIKQIRRVLDWPGLKFCKDLVECIIEKGKVRINVTPEQLKELDRLGFFCRNVDLQTVRFNDPDYYHVRKMEAITAVHVGDWKRAEGVISELRLLDGDWDYLNDDTSLNFLIGTPLETED